MRIISGKYKGSMIKGHDIIGTRPTLDRVKESLIASVQGFIEDSVCLDLFAGSGSIGIELLSNGVKSCYFNDSNYKAINVLKQNLDKLHIEEEYHILSLDYKKALLSLKKQDIKLDIIFLDPPYQENLISPCLKLIEEYKLLSKKGIIICEYEKEIIDKHSFNILKEKRYGDKFIAVLTY